MFRDESKTWSWVTETCTVVIAEGFSVIVLTVLMGNFSAPTSLIEDICFKKLFLSWVLHVWRRIRLTFML